MKSVKVKHSRLGILTIFGYWKAQILTSGESVILQSNEKIRGKIEPKNLPLHQL